MVHLFLNSMKLYNLDIVLNPCHYPCVRQWEKGTCAKKGNIDLIILKYDKTILKGILGLFFLNFIDENFSKI